MNKEEFKECSVVAYPRQIKFLHINGGAISYYVDRHVSDYVDRLQQQCQKQKEAIDKAIEYIEKLNKIIPRFWFTKLLELLKEVE